VAASAGWLSGEAARYTTSYRSCTEVKHNPFEIKWASKALLERGRRGEWGDPHVLRGSQRTPTKRGVIHYTDRQINIALQTSFDVQSWVPAMRLDGRKESQGVDRSNLRARSRLTSHSCPPLQAHPTQPPPPAAPLHAHRSRCQRRLSSRPTTPPLTSWHHHPPRLEWSEAASTPA